MFVTSPSSVFVSVVFFPSGPGCCWLLRCAVASLPPRLQPTSFGPSALLPHCLLPAPPPHRSSAPARSPATRAEAAQPTVVVRRRPSSLWRWRVRVCVSVCARALRACVRAWLAVQRRRRRRTGRITLGCCRRTFSIHLHTSVPATIPTHLKCREHRHIAASSHRKKGTGLRA